MGNARPQEPDWDRLQRASDLRARKDFQKTTPGQRVEEMLELSRELTALAARGRARR